MAVTGTSTGVVLVGRAYIGLNVLVGVPLRGMLPPSSLPIAEALVPVHLVFAVGIARWLDVPPG